LSEFFQIYASPISEADVSEGKLHLVGTAGSLQITAVHLGEGASYSEPVNVIVGQPHVLTLADFDDGGRYDVDQIQFVRIDYLSSRDESSELQFNVGSDEQPRWLNADSVFEEIGYEVSRETILAGRLRYVGSEIQIESSVSLDEAKAFEEAFWAMARGFPMVVDGGVCEVAFARWRAPNPVYQKQPSIKIVYHPAFRGVIINTSDFCDFPLHFYFLSPIPPAMSQRPVTLFTGQWADLPIAELLPKVKAMGYEGVELACWGDHFDVTRALKEKGYIESLWALLAEHDLGCWAISSQAST
jgi:hypothetical protein